MSDERSEVERLQSDLDFAHSVITELQHVIRELRHEIGTYQFIVRSLKGRLAKAA